MISTQLALCQPNSRHMTAGSNKFFNGVFPGISGYFSQYGFIVCMVNADTDWWPGADIV